MQIPVYSYVESGNRSALTYAGVPLFIVVVEGSDPKDKVVRDRFKEVLKNLAALLSWLEESGCGNVEVLDGSSTMIRALMIKAARSILDYAKRLPDGTYLCGSGRLEEAGDLDVPYCDPLRGEWVKAIWRDEDRKIRASCREEDAKLPGQLVDAAEMRDEQKGLEEKLGEGW